MNTQKKALLVGGLAIAGIAAFLLMKGPTDEFAGPSGGSAYGPSSGYEGGRAGTDIPWNLILGGENVNFPAPPQVDINTLLPDMPTSKKVDLQYARGGDVIGGVALRDPFVVAAGQPSTKKIETPAPSGIPNLLAGIADVFMKPVSLGVSGAKRIASAGGSMFGGTGTSGVAKKPFVVAATGTGMKADIGASGASGAGVIGSAGSGYTGSSGWTAPAPAAILSGGKKASSGGSVASQQYGGSGSVASYLSGKYGATHDIRGYSITGVPLYKPKVS